MRIAVTYEDGNVFQHFGHTENFKVYDVDATEIKGSEILPTDGSGHEALADFLKARGVDVLICGGCGAGAAAALEASGIEVFSGASGDADVAVETLLCGELTSAGINCDHHDHEEEHECGGCSGSCGSCGGGCGGPVPIFDGANVGRIVRVHYTAYLSDGTRIDSTHDEGKPLEFICGVGMILPIFDAACANLEVGQEIDIIIPAEMAEGHELKYHIEMVDVV